MSVRLLSQFAVDSTRLWFGDTDIFQASYTETESAQSCNMISRNIAGIMTHKNSISWLMVTL